MKHPSYRLLIRKLDGMWFVFEQHSVYDRDTNTHIYAYPRGIVTRARCYTTFEHLHEALISRDAALNGGWADVDTATIDRHRAHRLEAAEKRRVEDAAYDAQLKADQLLRQARREAEANRIDEIPIRWRAL